MARWFNLNECWTAHENMEMAAPPEGGAGGTASVHVPKHRSGVCHESLILLLPTHN
jgi:hypothetical protein